jgi:hypothetical protein
MHRSERKLWNARRLRPFVLWLRDERILSRNDCGAGMISTQMRIGAILFAVTLGGCAGVMETFGDPYIAPGKFRFLRCPDLTDRINEAESRRRELHALTERSGSGAVNVLVYGPDVNNVEAEQRALRQIAAEKNCNVRKAPAKPEPGMGPIH